MAAAETSTRELPRPQEALAQRREGPSPGQGPGDRGRGRDGPGAPRSTGPDLGHPDDDGSITHRVPGLLLRFLGAVLAIGLFFLVEGQLDAAALVVARFGVGIVLFALLVDVGRALAGTGPPLVGSFRPHRQRAEPLVDDHYRSVHATIKRFLDDGTWSERYADLMHEALTSRGVEPAVAERAIQRARESARTKPIPSRPLPVALAAGGAIVFGLAIILGVLLEAFGTRLLPTLTVFVGLGVYTLQVRTVGAGSRMGTLSVGVAGAVLVLVGGELMAAAHGGAWRTLDLVALVLVGATLVVGLTREMAVPSWRTLRPVLEDELATLRRAFVATLVAGLVLFPFKPLLDELFNALGLSLDVPYRIAVIGYATLAAFLAVELAGAWFALDRGDRLARANRRRRLEANAALMDLLDARAPGPDPNKGEQTDATTPAASAAATVVTALPALAPRPWGGRSS